MARASSFVIDSASPRAVPLSLVNDTEGWKSTRERILVGID
jgi:hypothetical protein